MLNLVVATKTEAEPLIDALKLKHVSSTFSLYGTEEVTLIISGMGKCKAAAASGWLGARTEFMLEKSGRKIVDCWLNVGIAGHSTAAIGTVYTAHKVLDYGCEKIWYPPRISPPLASENLTTVDKPLTEYLPDQLHDMEGSGFIETARMYSFAELVQCIKVVSDNSDQPFSQITPKHAHTIIADNLQSIIDFMNHMQDLAQSLHTPDISVAEQFFQHWKFSVSQKIILERLLQRYSVLYEPMTSIPENLKTTTSSKDVLHWLKASVNNADCSI